MASQWFYISMGEEIGPLSSSELRERARRGAISPDLRVRAADDSRWFAARDIRGLYDFVDEIQPMFSQRPPRNEAVSTPRSDSPAKKTRAKTVIRGWHVVATVGLVLAAVAAPFIPWNSDNDEPSDDTPARIVQAQFNANDVDETVRWLEGLIPAYLAALDEFNRLRANAEAVRLNEHVASVPSGTKIRWRIRVLAVQADEVLLSMLPDVIPILERKMPLPRIHFSVQTEPPGGWHKSDIGKEFVLMIGRSISRERAKGLKNGDILVITGELAWIEATYFPQSLPTDSFVAFTAKIVNAVVE